jgi:hypothetical protein
MARTMTVYYYQGPKSVHNIPDRSWPTPVPNIIGHGAFVEVEDGVFVSTKEIHRIEVKENA